MRYAGNVVQYLAGTEAASATMIAFFGALLHDIGQEDVSIQEVLLGAVDAGLLSYGYSKETNHRADAAGGGYVSCADGFVQFRLGAGLQNPRQWHRLVQLLEMPELAEDPRFLTPTLRNQNRNEMAEIVVPWVMTQSKRGVAERAQALGFAAGPVLDIGEVVEDPHHNARGFFVEVDHPMAGRFRYPGAPFKLQEGGWEIRSPAPTLGQHNKEIYCDRLGYSREDLVHLRALGII